MVAFFEADVVSAERAGKVEDIAGAVLYLTSKLVRILVSTNQKRFDDT
jgi:hypothetical protein